ncbi:alanine racemase [Leeia oryzae]|uniref:alanine racemase n=1 Tax=Leeia oryzae TaxID=356662 RepID=UPI0003804987|nr:alanine racemase [Leeia oryzae]
MTRPIAAVIDRGALLHNLQLIRARTAGSRLMAVLAGNAYGHGLQEVASVLSEVDAIGVIRLEDAVALRYQGLKCPIVLLEGIHAEQDLDIVAEHQLGMVIHRQQQLQWLLAAWLSVRIDVWVNLNTGLNQFGFSADELPHVMAGLAKANQAGRIVLMSELATANEEDGCLMQQSVFEMEIAPYASPASLANSDAVLLHDGMSHAWVRVGKALLGLGSVARADEGALRPVMSLQSQVVAERMIAAGEPVGYGATFHADHDMRIGIVACGYADGYPAQLPIGTPVFVNGHRTRLLGRVAMHTLMIDLTGFPDCQVGASVELWGEGVPLTALASILDLPAATVATQVPATVPRVLRSVG